MRKVFSLLLICLVLLSGCMAGSAQEETAPVGQLQIANPWKSYNTLADAEGACGLTYPVPGNIPAGYTAESYRVMSSSLLEVTYRNDDGEITVRMQAGENLDISGVYANFTKTETFDQRGASVTKMLAADCCVYLIHKNSYSFSIYTTSLTSDPACCKILTYIC